MDKVKFNGLMFLLIWRDYEGRLYRLLGSERYFLCKILGKEGI